MSESLEAISEEYEAIMAGWRAAQDEAARWHEKYVAFLHKHGPPPLWEDARFQASLRREGQKRE